MAITTCFQKTALYRLEDSCSHFSMVKLEKNQELLEDLLIPVNFSMNAVSPWTSQLTRECFSFPLSEKGTQFLCWLAGSRRGLREKVGFRAWCKWLFQHKKGEIVLSLAVGGSFIYQTAGNKDSKTEDPFGSPCCCFPETWLLLSRNEPLDEKKPSSHQVPFKLRQLESSQNKPAWDGPGAPGQNHHLPLPWILPRPGLLY